MAPSAEVSAVERTGLEGYAGVAESDGSAGSSSEFYGGVLVLSYLEELSKLEQMERDLEAQKLATNAALLSHWGIVLNETVVTEDGKDWIVRGLESSYRNAREANRQPWLKGNAMTKKGWSKTFPSTIYEWRIRGN